MENDFKKAGGEWREYNLEKLFGKATRGKRLKASDRLPGTLPFVTAGEENTGISAYIGNNVDIFLENTITIDMFGSAKFRGYQYGADDHVAVVHTEHLSKTSSQFIAACIHKASYSGKFSYSRNFYAKDADELVIELPTLNNNLAFSYMETYIKTLEAERIETLEAYLTVTGLKDYHLTKKDEQILDKFAKLSDTKSRVEEWGTYGVGELFDIFTGRDIIISRTEKGNIPLVSHQHQNNGISEWISQLSDRRLFNHKETIALADRGVFLATTQGQDFHIGTRVKALRFKAGEQTREVRLFVTTAINRLQILFTEYSANATNKLPDLEFSLPTQNNQPDYTFMTDLIKAVEKLVIKDLVEWTDKKIAATKEVVAR